MVLQEPIAVIGYDLMFPGEASTPAGFAELLAKGHSAHGEIPKDRWNPNAFYHPDPLRAGSTQVRTGHFLKEDVTRFDAPFFALSAAEASFLDIQQRMLLETTYRALENAGISLRDVSGTDTSVFSGAFTYEDKNIRMADLEAENLKYALLGTSGAMLSNRISWFYNLKGQSLTVETACSSSLVACHLAAQSLDNKESSMSIVTGCNFLHSPETTIQLGNIGVLSPDSKSYSFDDKANGYARSEGVAVVVLKRVSDAVRDGDTVRAVIRNIGCNQDGKSPGVTVPTAEAQAALISRLYAEAGLNPGLTRYFEAHATGTSVGDPIELSAIAEFFSRHLSANIPLYVGSVKTNVGHLEGVAGLAGMLKAVHILESGTIPEHLWFDKWNSQVNVDTSVFKVPTTSVHWPGGGHVARRVSVNSFGIGGTNAHAILDDARAYLESHGLAGHHTTHTPGLVRDHSSSASQDSSLSSWEDVVKPGPFLFVLSAFDENGVDRLSNSYLQYLERRGNGPAKASENFLGSLAYTLAAKRSRFVWRAAVVAESSDSLVQALRSIEKPVRSSMNRRLGLVFTGQGAQWPGMGRELHKYRVFRESVEAASRYLESLGCSWSLADLLFDGNNADSDIMDTPGRSQPIVTVLQVALVELLQNWSTEAHAVIGHSSGEIAASFAAGAISRESAWTISYHRGVLAEKLVNTGGMIAVGAGPEEAKIYVDRTNNAAPDNEAGSVVAIACVNSPKNVTISGPPEAIDRLAAVLALNGVFGRKLRVTNAYHSSYMAPVAEEYGQILLGKIARGAATPQGQTRCQQPKFFSSLLGREASPEELLDPSYWVQNLLSPVEFSNGLHSLLTDASPELPGTLITAKNVSVNDLVEIGPHAALRTPIRDVLEALAGDNDVGYTSLLNRESNGADRTVLEAAGWLFSRGHQLDMARIVLGATPTTPPEMLTDLPGYSFDHSTSYWTESRLSKEYRFRKFPRHDLLGAPVPDWNPSNAVWGHYIRVQENPWVKDHVVTGTVLYPAAGMLVMAIEAIKQLADFAVPLAGLRFKDVSFHSAVNVPEDLQGLETRFYLRPLWEGTASQSATWNEFELWSFHQDEWRNHCRGWIQAEPAAAHTVVDGGLEQRLFEETCAEKIAAAERNCLDPLTNDQVYSAFDQIGIHYGPTFQNLSDVHVSTISPVAVATITAPDLRDVMPGGGFTHPHVIHPATLDAALSAALTALNRGGAESGPTSAAVPTKIKDMWLAASSASNKNGAATAPLQSIRLTAEANDIGTRKYSASMVGVDLHSRKPVLTIKGLECTAIVHGSHAAAGAASQADKTRCYNVDWRPDATLWLRTEDSATVLSAMAVPDALQPTPKEAADRADTFTLGCAYIKRYLDAREPFSRLDPTKPHYRKFLEWGQRVIGRLEEKTPSRPWGRFGSAEEVIAALEHTLEKAGPNSKVVVECGRALPEILTGHRDPLQLLFTDRLAEDTYVRPYPLTVIASYVRTLAHKNPHMNILEVGAGTGATTGFVLEALGGGKHNGGGRLLLGRYDFTDLSPAFFEPASEKFHNHVHKMRFTVFNAEHDPVAQGLEPGQHDIVIAANVVHATRSIHETLSNMRRLLRPGGKLILFELTDKDTNANFAFGLLPGWWLSNEEDRKAGPLLTSDTWDARLQESGYSGIDLSFGDGFDPPDVHVMVATATSPRGVLSEWGDVNQEAAHGELPSILIITDGQCILQKRLARRLEQSLSSSIPSAVVASATLDCLRNTDVERKVLVSLVDISRSVLAQPGEETFEAVKAMCASARAILWIVSGGGPQPPDPHADLVLGFARNLRLEASARMVTLGLSDQSINTSSRAAELIVSFVQDKLLAPQDTSKIVDNDFREVGGLLTIPRLVPASGLFSSSGRNSAKLEPKPIVFGGDHGSPQRALRLEVNTLGLLDSLCFTDDEVYSKDVADGEVEFRIMAAGLNFRNVLYALGQLPAYAQHGSEAAGIVTRTGKDTPFKPGDRVFGINQRTIGTFARSPHRCLTTMPAHLSFVEAAAIPVSFMTAQMALYDYARIQKGETVLIHSATGGLGQACIQLAQLVGAEVFATVGSLEKCEMLTKTYGIRRDHIFSSRDLTFAAGVMRMTDGRGVDVVVNSLSGAALRASWECVAPWGRFAECGKKDVLGAATLPMEMFTRNVSFRVIDLEVIEASPERIEAVGKIWQSVHRLLAPGFGSIQPLHVFPYSQLVEAHKFMQSGTHIGKIVLEPRPDETVLAVPSGGPNWSFNAHATYVISGGFGGIGRGITRWMVRRGVRNLVLLSRTGPTSMPAKALLAELEIKGVRVHSPPADVTNSAALLKVVEYVSANMPPVKGCVQAAMALKPSLVASMSVADYRTCIDPKVTGTLNLQQYLPHDMDFFVMLSSLVGLAGEPGQANYAAGNTFQDAFARHLVSCKRQKAVAIDLGMMGSIGYVSESLDRAAQFVKQVGLEEMRPDELYEMLDEACDPSLALPSATESQAVVGLPDFQRPRDSERPALHESDPLFVHLRPDGSGSAAEGGEGAEEGSVSWRAQLSAADSMAEATDIVVQVLAQKLFKMLKADVLSDLSAPLHSYGLDSLVAIELRSWLLDEMDAEVAIFDLVGSGGVAALAPLIVKRSSLVKRDVS